MIGAVADDRDDLAAAGGRAVTPLEFMQRLAALVPPPSLHLIRFHGVLAPNAFAKPAASGNHAGAC